MNIIRQAGAKQFAKTQKNCHQVPSAKADKYGPIASWIFGHLSLSIVAWTRSILY